MSLLSTWNLTKDDNFRGRVAIAVYRAGMDILNSGINENSDRFKLAKEAKDSNNLAAASFIWPVAVNPTISAQAATGESNDVISDSDIEYVVASVWDEVARRRYTAVPAVATPPAVVPVPVEPLEVVWQTGGDVINGS